MLLYLMLYQSFIQYYLFVLEVCLINLVLLIFAVFFIFCLIFTFFIPDSTPPYSVSSSYLQFALSSIEIILFLSCVLEYTQKALKLHICITLTACYIFGYVVLQSLLISEYFVIFIVISYFLIYLGLHLQFFTQIVLKSIYIVIF